MMIMMMLMAYCMCCTWKEIDPLSVGHSFLSSFYDSLSSIVGVSLEDKVISSNIVVDLMLCVMLCRSDTTDHD